MVDNAEIFELETSTFLCVQFLKGSVYSSHGLRADAVRPVKV
jgi:hypothetical protein